MFKVILSQVATSDPNKSAEFLKLYNSNYDFTHPVYQ